MDKIEREKNRLKTAKWRAKNREAYNAYMRAYLHGPNGYRKARQKANRTNVDKATDEISTEPLPQVVSGRDRST